MEVILLESLNKLGKIGDVVNVKNGFARNFLIPQKKALRANKENKDYFTKIKGELIEKNDKIIDNAKSDLKKISNDEIIFIRNASDNGQLYGSVSPKDISNYFNEKKISIKPSSINLYSAIKKVGIYNINIKLHAEVSCELKINVATSVENAKVQKEESEKPIIKSKTAPKDPESKKDDKSEEEKKIIQDNESETQDSNSQDSPSKDIERSEIEKKEKDSKD
jgi:large subunit ribosomal protein L9